MPNCSIITCINKSVKLGAGKKGVSYHRLGLTWLLFRSLTVIVSVIGSSLRAHNPKREIYSKVVLFVNLVDAIGIAMKCFMPYYDERGIVIKKVSRTFVHYASRGLLVDFLPLLPWSLVIADHSTEIMVATFLRYLQIYLVIGHFEYMSDQSNANVILIKILKFATFLVATVFTFAHYFHAGCTKIIDDKIYLTDKFCFKEDIANSVVDELLPRDTYDEFYVECLNFIHDGMMGIQTSSFEKNTDFEISAPYLTCNVVTWMIKCCSLATLVMATRGDTMYQHSLGQLRRFLTSERLEKKFIDRTHEYFVYQWTRTRGLNLEELMTERLGAVFRQDLNFYYFKSTMVALDTLLKGGEPLQRELAGLSAEDHYLPGDDIAREMDLVPNVFIVHRGHVAIYKHNLKLITLTKGCIFGQLEGPKLRPFHITARAEDHVDCLRINIIDFHKALLPSSHENLISTQTSTKDFVKMRRKIVENAFNTVKYILRGDFIIKFPLMAHPIEAANSKWLCRYRALVQVVCPLVASALLACHYILPRHIEAKMMIVLWTMDVIHFTYIVLMFFQMELKVVSSKLTMKYVPLKHFRSPPLYMDVISLVIPLVAPFTDYWWLNFFRTLRMHLYFSFYRRITDSIQNGAMNIVMKLGVFLLTLHIITCITIDITCVRPEDEFVSLPKPPEWVIATINSEQLTIANGSEPKGCYLTVINFTPGIGDGEIYTKVLSKSWAIDYLLGMNYVLGMLTSFVNPTVINVNIDDYLFKIVVGLVLMLFNLWFTAEAISVMMTAFHELYEYDYHVLNLIDYLYHNRVCTAVIDSVRKYTEVMWERQKGTWLPDIVRTGSACLQEDLFSELYMHHFNANPVFRELPNYILRQLVTQCNRVILLPGRYIVRQGDVRPAMYFIHEGEVEKWRMDTETGEQKIVSLLTNGGYFGTIPSLFPYFRYTYSFFTRTVVDAVFIHADTMHPVLQCYPEERKELYLRAQRYRTNQYPKSHQQ